MRCPSCDHVSLGSCCTHCGRCDVPQGVAFSPLDIFDPIGLGRSMGTSVQEGGVTGGVKDATGAVSSLATTMKWIAITGAVLVGGTLVYSVIKFIPKMAEAAASNVKESGRVAGQIASRAA